MGTGEETWNTLSEEEAQTHMQKWYDWSDKIADITVDAEALKSTAYKIKGKEMKVSEGFVADENIYRIGGYYVIELDADSTIDDAIEIAKGCPTFEVNGTLEVREIDPS